MTPNREAKAYAHLLRPLLLLAYEVFTQILEQFYWHRFWFQHEPGKTSVLIPILTMGSVISSSSKIGSDSFESAVHVVLFTLEWSEIRQVLKHKSSLENAGSLITELNKKHTSKSKGGQDSQESSSTWVTSTVRGKNIMMLGAIFWAARNVAYLHTKP